MRKPLISIISAMTKKKVIGQNNQLPWHLPADLQHFKQLTLNKPIIMGRKTWQSLPGLLPQRLHIVISRNPDFQCQGAILAHSIEDAIQKAGNVAEIMIIGGANLYTQAIQIADKMYLTQIEADDIQGDAFFPIWDINQWHLTDSKKYKADKKNKWNYAFLTYQRK